MSTSRAERAAAGGAAAAAPAQEEEDERERIIHASCVAFQSREDGVCAGVLIRGPAGAGKSSFALMLMGFGAALVADDCVRLSRGGDGRLWATAPDEPALSGLIEARGVGVIRVAPTTAAALAWVVDLASAASLERLPALRCERMLGATLPRLSAPPSAAAAAAVACLARGGTLLDPDAALR
ncbi:MAG: hypothetical protein AAGM38_02500 [Pseudomonadota bacterium]